MRKTGAGTGKFLRGGTLPPPADPPPQGCLPTHRASGLAGRKAEAGRQTGRVAGRLAMLAVADCGGCSSCSSCGGWHIADESRQKANRIPKMHKFGICL